MELSPLAAALGYRLDARAVTGSSNADCAEALRAGDPGRLWVVAARQESGRGRHGRAWSSPEGNLYASCALLSPCPMHEAPQLGYLAGLSLLDAVRAVAPPSVAGRFALKWPNDLLADGGKISGILLEGVARTGGRPGLVMGFGVNVARMPEDAPYPVARLVDLAPGATRERLFLALSDALAERLAAFEAAEPATRLARLREEWTTHAAGREGGARVRVGDGFKRGRVAGLDGHGRLLLETQAGIETIDAGDMTISTRDDRE
ncbi:biotin--[acetyl-CoA-carboxylase] ligase [Salinarimonas ramus]|uniref:biotin--[biotin carboxyl-carrier protein] ligase n=1 Tax=Salinarimonas ramus TaxID=690164 RepID=A0A917QJ22_9HYPH|nr:biotin--[acetyl-CoA-carboxylase] ligase [Salinarimonas ramus]GGK53214.1 biotin--[acetyl-CoA-carboxylase] ligase [Salinarimonas ramus]